MAGDRPSPNRNHFPAHNNKAVGSASNGNLGEAVAAEEVGAAEPGEDSNQKMRWGANIEINIDTFSTLRPVCPCNGDYEKFLEDALHESEHEAGAGGGDPPPNAPHAAVHKVVANQLWAMWANYAEADEGNNIFCPCDCDMLWSGWAVDIGSAQLSARRKYFMYAGLPRESPEPITPTPIP